MDGFIEDMLKEDKGFGDFTSEALIPKDQEIYAIFVSKDVGVAAGMVIVEEMFLEEGI